MDDYLKCAEIMNIQQTVQRAREEGIPLSSYTLRRAIQSKELPCRVVGRTYLIRGPMWSNGYCAKMNSHICRRNDPGLYSMWKNVSVFKEAAKWHP